MAHAPSAGRIVRPDDVDDVSTEYSAITRFHPRTAIATLRGWLRGELPPLDGASVAEPIPEVRLSDVLDE